MKLLQRLKRGIRMKRRRPPTGSSSSGGALNHDCKTTHSTKDSVDDTSLSSLNQARESWRAENFLVAGAPQEVDWWEEVDHDDDDSESDHIHNPEEQEPHVAIEAFRKEDRNESIVLTTTATTNTTTTVTADRRRLRFRNRGFETWLQTRQAWQQRAMLLDSEHLDQLKQQLSPYPSLAQRREIIRQLADKYRDFELPRRMPLSAMVQVFQEVWNDGSDGDVLS